MVLGIFVWRVCVLSNLYPIKSSEIFQHKEWFFVISVVSVLKRFHIRINNVFLNIKSDVEQVIIKEVTRV